MRSALLFQLVIVPLRSLLMIASSEESTIAPSRRLFRSARFVSVVSRAIFDAPMISPRAFFTGEIVRETSNKVPSLRRRNVSKWSTRSPFLSFAKMEGSAALSICRRVLPPYSRTSAPRSCSSL